MFKLSTASWSEVDIAYMEGMELKGPCNNGLQVDTLAAKVIRVTQHRAKQFRNRYAIDSKIRLVVLMVSKFE